MWNEFLKADVLKVQGFMAADETVNANMRLKLVSLTVWNVSEQGAGGVSCCASILIRCLWNNRNKHTHTHTCAHIQYAHTHCVLLTNQHARRGSYPKHLFSFPSPSQTISFSHTHARFVEQILHTDTAFSSQTRTLYLRDTHIIFLPLTHTQQTHTHSLCGEQSQHLCLTKLPSPSSVKGLSVWEQASVWHSHSGEEHKPTQCGFTHTHTYTNNTICIRFMRSSLCHGQETHHSWATWVKPVSQSQ